MLHSIFMHVFSTHKVVGITTLSRADHLTAQTREYHCTRDVLPQVLARGIIRYRLLLSITILAYFRS